MVVVYACNNSYVYQTIISMVSLLKHNNDIRLYLVADHITDSNLRLLQESLKKYSQNLVVIDAEDIFENISLEQQGRHPRTIYAKLFLAEVIDSDKLLYLDSDTVIAGSLKELTAMDMGENLIAGVLMPYSDKVKTVIGISTEANYICDGVVLFNMKLWREMRMQRVCLKHIQEFAGDPPMQSEGTLNRVCEKRIKILAPQYNLMPSMLMFTGDQIKKLFKTCVYYRKEEIQHAREDYRIVHFMNELYNRPWYQPCKHPLKNLYLDIEQELFEGKTIVEKRLSGHTAFTAGMARNLPFALFAMLYHIKNRMY